jgi:prepilin-type N-terminal cleavage/methylation domain-containing protein
MKKLSLEKGFTLIELLVVVGIIGMLATIVMVALNDAKNKGGNAAVKSNLAGARSQADVLYNIRTANTNSYTNVCTNGAVDGGQGIGSAVLTAARAARLTTYATNAIGSNTTATCNDSTTAWAAEVPLIGGGMWCVDSTSKSKSTGASTLTSATDYACD